MSISNLFTPGTTNKPWLNLFVNKVFSNDIDVEDLILNKAEDGIVQTGDYSPTIPDTLGFANPTLLDGKYVKINDVVNAYVVVEGDMTSGLLGQFIISDLPVPKATDFSSSSNGGGSGNIVEDSVLPTVLQVSARASLGSKDMVISMDMPNVTGTYTCKFFFSYVID